MTSEIKEQPSNRTSPADILWLLRAISRLFRGFREEFIEVEESDSRSTAGDSGFMQLEPLSHVADMWLSSQNLPPHPRRLIAIPIKDGPSGRHAV